MSSRVRLSAAQALDAPPSLATTTDAAPLLPAPLPSPLRDDETGADAALDDPVLNETKDPMNALWSFAGHRLRELQPADRNVSGAADSSGSGLSRGADDEGFPVLYGSCGRDKRYARCSVCYFRGKRCNSAHYCACCQRPVCIRPRVYPGETHAKICWNVLHMDADMVQRVEKKKRKLRTMTPSLAARDNGVVVKEDASLVEDPPQQHTL